MGKRRLGQVLEEDDVPITWISRLIMLVVLTLWAALRVWELLAPRVQSAASGPVGPLA